MTKPTGNPVGRPKTKEYSTLLARVPQDLVDRVKRYASVHRSTIAELIRDGLEWRITEGDPRTAFMYDTNNNGYCSNTEKQTYLPETDLTPDMLDAAEDVEEIPRGVSVAIPRQPAAPPGSPRVPQEEREAVYAQLDAWKAEGLSLQKMADRLNTAQVPTFSGKGRWMKGTIGNVLAAQRQAVPVA